MGRVEGLEAPGSGVAAGPEVPQEIDEPDHPLAREEAIGVFQLGQRFRRQIVQVDHGQPVHGEALERRAAARVPVGDVEDQLRAVDAPDDLAGEPGRTDGAVGEPEELEGHPHAGGSGEVARAGEPLARAG